MPDFTRFYWSGVNTAAAVPFLHVLLIISVQGSEEIPMDGSGISSNVEQITTILWKIVCKNIYDDFSSLFGESHAGCAS